MKMTNDEELIINKTFQAKTRASGWIQERVEEVPRFFLPPRRPTMQATTTMIISSNTAAPIAAPMMTPVFETLGGGGDP